MASRARAAGEAGAGSWPVGVAAAAMAAGGTGVAGVGATGMLTGRAMGIEIALATPTGAQGKAGAAAQWQAAGWVRPAQD